MWATRSGSSNPTFRGCWFSTEYVRLREFRRYAFGVREENNIFSTLSTLGQLQIKILKQVKKQKVDSITLKSQLKIAMLRKPPILSTLLQGVDIPFSPLTGRALNSSLTPVRGVRRRPLTTYFLPCRDPTNGIARTLPSVGVRDQIIRQKLGQTEITLAIRNKDKEITDRQLLQNPCGGLRSQGFLFSLWPVTNQWLKRLVKKNKEIYIYFVEHHP